MVTMLKKQEAYMPKQATNRNQDKGMVIGDTRRIEMVGRRWKYLYLLEVEVDVDAITAVYVDTMLLNVQQQSNRQE